MDPQPFLLIPFVTLLSILSPNPVQTQCGRLTRCDYLVPISVFQLGSCGRAARCYWELRHLEQYILGDNSRGPGYELKIKAALCRIPNYYIYKKLTDNSKGPKLLPCGVDPSGVTVTQPPIPGAPPPPTYDDFPVPDLYINPDNTQYLKQIEDCRQMELDCLVKLNDTIIDICVNHVTHIHLDRIESQIKLKYRGKLAYEFIHGKNAPKQQNLTLGNMCLFRRLGRLRHPPTDQTSNSKFDDIYVISKGILRLKYHKQILQLRPPYYDLYVLYFSDPLGMFSQLAPPADKWWNETKAYQELAHYLPRGMVVDSNQALKCVYEKVNAPEMVWRPEKFCWGTPTLVCVEEAVLRGTDCINDANFDLRGFNINTDMEDIPT